MFPEQQLVTLGMGSHPIRNIYLSAISMSENLLILIILSVQSQPRPQSYYANGLNGRSVITSPNEETVWLRSSLEAY